MRASQRPLLDCYVIGGAPSRKKRRIRTICHWRCTRQERRGEHLDELDESIIITNWKVQNRVRLFPSVITYGL